MLIIFYIITLFYWGNQNTEKGKAMRWSLSVVNPQLVSFGLHNEEASFLLIVDYWSPLIFNLAVRKNWQQTEWFPVTKIQIFLNHTFIEPVTDPLTEGNMNSTQLAGRKESPPYKLRISYEIWHPTVTSLSGWTGEEKPLWKVSNRFCKTETSNSWNASSTSIFHPRSLMG